MASPAAAATVTVNNEDDLRAAIFTANGNAEFDTITLDADITLTTVLPPISQSLEIVGAGFSVNGDGNLAFNDDGVSPSIQLTFTGVTVNNASYGVYTGISDVVITDSTFDNAPVRIDGTAYTVNVANSTFDNASAGNGLYIVGTDSFDVTVSGSSASGNSDDGFNIDLETDSTVTLTDCVADSNGNDGFRLALDTGSTATVAGATSSGNTRTGFSLESDLDSTVAVSAASANNNSLGGFEIDTRTGSSTSVTGSTATENVDYGLFAYVEDAATLAVSDSTFSTTTVGPGIDIESRNGSTVTMTRVTSRENQGRGMALTDRIDASVPNTLTISESTLADNFDSGLTITGSNNTSYIVDHTTISGNESFFGGGMFTVLDDTSSLTLSNSTVSGNHQLLFGAIVIIADADLTAPVLITSSTIVNNSSCLPLISGGLLIASGQYSISNSILAGNTNNEGNDPADFQLATTAPAPTGTVNYSLVQSPMPGGLAAVDAGTGNLKNVDPLLGPLANNGGVTLTHLPQDSSPVVNAGNPGTTTPALDQRGQSRVISTIDMGAVEVQLALAATGSDAALPLAGGAAMLLATGALLVLLRRRRTAY